MSERRPLDSKASSHNLSILEIFGDIVVIGNGDSKVIHLGDPSIVFVSGWRTYHHDVSEPLHPLRNGICERPIIHISLDADDIHGFIDELN